MWRASAASVQHLIGINRQLAEFMVLHQRPSKSVKNSEATFSCSVNCWKFWWWLFNVSQASDHFCCSKSLWEGLRFEMDGQHSCSTGMHHLEIHNSVNKWRYWKCFVVVFWVGKYIFPNKKFRDWINKNIFELYLQLYLTRHFA